MKIEFKTKIIIFFLFYFIFRITIFNINSAEWGDSYRILRATSFIENGSYPKDEKRPPLYSAFLTLIPNNIDQVIGGRFLMIVVSLISVYLFYLLITNLNTNFTENQKLLSIILFAFNPLFVYWSMRIYADTFFLMFCLLAFVIYFKNLKKNSIINIILLSTICFLSIMTRFEGYILTSSIILGFIFEFVKSRNKVYLFNAFLFIILGAGLFFWAINTPWTFFKNPLSSSYVDEANRRAVGIYDIVGFILHLVFLLGNFFAFYFILYDRKKLYEFIKNNFVIFVFCIIELVLAFVWPAAVPRLLVQVLPILILLMVVGIYSALEGKKLPYLFVFPLALVIYVFGQFLVRSQFLLTNYYFMLVLIIVSIVQFFFLLRNNHRKFIFSLIFGTFLWMSFYVYLHKDIYKVLNIGVSNFYSQYQKDGVIVTNDVSALTRFYFGDSLKYLREVDFGIDIQKYLKDKQAKYIIVTNEHNPDMEFTVSKYPYLEPIFEHREYVNGREFFVVIAKVNLK